MNRRLLLFALITLGYLPVRAEPQGELLCTLAGPGLIQIDGLIDDWGNMPELTKVDIGDAHDAGLAVRCAYDAEKLYLMVNVTDDRLIRTRQKTKDEDHLVFLFGPQALEVYPASADQGAKLAFGWVGKPGPKVAVADSLQKHGWSVELAIPRRGLGGQNRNAPGALVAIEFYDVDSFSPRRIETVLATGEIMLSFEEAAASLRGFLDGVHLRRGDITLDTLAELDGEPGRERLVAAGKFLAVIGDSYTYVELPVAGARDVLSVELADVTGTGRSCVMLRTVERGNGGSREVLSIWSFKGGQWSRLFAHEIAKQQGRARLVDTWQLVSRGRGKRGLDLVIKPGEVTGFTAETWNETPASDMAPILLPWGDKKQEVWHFDNDEVSGG